VLVKSFHPHLFDAGLDQLADAVVDHRGGDGGIQAKAVREVCRDVVLTTRDMHIETASLSKGDDPRVESMDQSPEREKIQCTVVLTNREFRHSEYRSPE
jgi:hypothetical protein